MLTMALVRDEDAKSSTRGKQTFEKARNKMEGSGGGVERSCGMEVVPHDLSKQKH